MTRTVAEMALQLLSRSVDDVAGHEKHIANALVSALHADPVAMRHVSWDEPAPDPRYLVATASSASFVAYGDLNVAPVTPDLAPTFAPAFAPSGATLH